MVASVKTFLRCAFCWENDVVFDHEFYQRCDCLENLLVAQVYQVAVVMPIEGVAVLVVTYER